MAGTAVATVIKHRSRGIVRTNITVVTDAGGDATATTVGVGFGRLVAVFYDGGLDASATVTLKDAKGLASLLVITTGTQGTPVKLRPTRIVQNQVGADIAAGATLVDVNRDIYLSGKVTVTVVAGGNAVTGKLSLIVDEDGIGDIALTV